MKKFYTTIGLAFLLFQSESSFSQTSFKFKVVDTLVYGDTLTAGDLEIDWNYILNKTSNPVTIDAVRIANVSGTWTSAFCLDVCYAPFIDSVRYTIPANDSVPYIPHFYIDATPDSQFVKMKIKNANVPTDVAYQRFFCVTKIGYGAGMHEYANLANVSLYPSPVVANSDFNLNITNVKVQSKEFSLAIYNIDGRKVSTINNLKENNNTLNLGLAAGMYSYSLIAGDQTLNAGTFTVVK